MVVYGNFWLLILTAAGMFAVLIPYFIYQRRQRQHYTRACFDAMLRMLLQPTPTNIAALDKLLCKRLLSLKLRRELLVKAEVEADCLSIMPTGELRSSQPFLQRRYNQILDSAKSARAVTELVTSRLASF
ncbi:MAG: hypothetical protein AB1489_21115 [Acidobacteriota bacterium]